MKMMFIHQQGWMLNCENLRNCPTQQYFRCLIHFHSAQISVTMNDSILWRCVIQLQLRWSRSRLVIRRTLFTLHTEEEYVLASYAYFDCRDQDLNCWSSISCSTHGAITAREMTIFTAFRLFARNKTNRSNLNSDIINIYNTKWHF